MLQGLVLVVTLDQRVDQQLILDLIRGQWLELNRVLNQIRNLDQILSVIVKT